MTTPKSITDDLQPTEPEAAKPKLASLYTHKTHVRQWSADENGFGHKRFDCLSIVQDSTYATVCVRTCFGDTGFYDYEVQDWCDEPVCFLKQASRCGPVVATRYDHLWLVTTHDLPKRKFQDLREFFGDEGRWPYPTLHWVSVPVLEEAFGTSVEGIAALARAGAFGNADTGLTNLKSLALAACVFGQQLAEVAL
jgi:hypothetical protein